MVAIPVLLTAIVVNKQHGKPSGQFFELADGDPFHRGTDPAWSWEVERERVLAYYRAGQNPRARNRVQQGLEQRRVGG